MAIKPKHVAKLFVTNTLFNTIVVLQPSVPFIVIFG